MTVAFITATQNYTILGTLNSVETIAGGGAGIGGGNTPNQGSSGGGGAYAINTNATFLTLTGSVNVGVGPGGAANQTTQQNGGDTYFNATSLANAATLGITQAVASAQGTGGSATGVAGLGGTAGTGTTVNAGGNAGTWTSSTSGPVPGGGGAGGPNGVGAKGANNTNAAVPGCGGGGNGGGTPGSAVASGTVGGNGGANSLGTGSGVGGGGTSGNPGTLGGGGGGAGFVATAGIVGGAGGPGAEWDAGHGSGGGAGGNSDGTTGSASNSPGGNYGGGGTGTSNASSNNSGAGAPGIVRVVYTASLGSQALNVGRVNPRIFRPYSRPTGGLNPILAFPTYPTPSTAVSLFAQGIVQTNLRLSIAPTSGINSRSTIETFSREQLGASLALAAKASAQSEVRLTPTTQVGLFGRIFTEIQARFTQPSGSLALLGRISTTVKSRLAQPSGSLSLLGRISTTVQSRLSQPSGSLALLGRISTTVQSHLSQPSGSLALLGRISTTVQLRLSQASGSTSLFARTIAQIKSTNTITATSQQTAALLGKTLIAIMVRVAPSNKVGLLGRANGPTIQGRAVTSVTVGLFGRAIEITRATSQTTLSTILYTVATVTTKIRLGSPIGTVNILGRIATQVKAFPTITVQSPIASALSGVGKIVITARAKATNVVTLFGRAAVEIGPQGSQPSNYINYGYLFGGITSAVKTASTLTAQSPLTRALAGAVKAMITARAAPSSSSGLLGRAKGPAIQSRITTSVSTALAGAVKAVITVRLQPPSGSASLFARVVSQAKSVNTIITTAPLFARAISQVKSVNTIIATAPLVTALNGFAKVIVTARSSVPTLTIGLFGRVATQVKLRLSPPGTQALIATATAMLMARFRPPSATVPLAGRMTLTSTVVPTITATRSLFGRSTASVRAVSAITRAALLSALATMTTAARAQTTGKTLLLGRTAVAMLAQSVLVASQALRGRASAVTQAKLAQASRNIFFTALATVMATARLTAPQSTVALLGRITTAVKPRGFTFTVGNLQALTGRIGAQTKARANSLGLRSLVRFVSTIVSRARPVSTVTIAYTAKTTVTVFTSTTQVD